MVLLSLSVVACSGESPEGVAKTYMNTIYTEDAVAYLQLFPTEVREAFESLGSTDGYLKQTISSTNARLKQLYGNEWYRRIDVKEASSTEDTATVEIIIDDITIQIIKMEKEDDKWRVSLDTPQ
jgi:hypothetical protein